MATYTISPTSPNEIYITNASTRGWVGGDILLIPSGTYSVIEIDNFGGELNNPIIIKNSGGQVIVDGPIRFKSNVHHVNVTGNGVVGITYGFKCKSFSFDRVNHFSINNIEIGPNPDGVGIYGKQDPYVGLTETHYPNYVGDTITIDSCYVHDVAGEGMYIGHTYPDGDPANSGLIPQRLNNVTISNCIVEYTGWDGIQLSNARDNCKIFKNYVSNFGLSNIDGQRAGIISGGNTNCDVYENVVLDGLGNGIEFFGYGVMRCYKNIITNVGNTTNTQGGEESIYGTAYINQVETNPKQKMVIYDNQIYYPKSRGAIRFNDNNNSELAEIYNNKFYFSELQPDNWQSLYFFLQQGFLNINNTLNYNLMNTNTTLGGWNAVVHLPSTYTANPTTYYPVIYFIPGLGEIGTNVALAKRYGPNAYVQGGWDGKINGRDYIVISIQPPSAYPRPSQIKTILNAAEAAYRINTSKVAMTGLSMGGWASCIFASYKATPSDTTYLNRIKVLVDVQGVKPEDTYDSTSPYPQRFADFANAGGKFLGFDQTQDGRDVVTIATAMNAAVANSAVYRQTSFGNGGHCCWDNFYGGSTGTQPNSFTTIGTIYNYIDNALFSFSNLLPTVTAGPDVTISLPTNFTNLNGNASDPDGSITTYLWTKVSGPAAGVITNANTPVATLTSLVVGTYVFRLTATDNTGASVFDEVTITVNPDTSILNTITLYKNGTYTIA